MPIHRCPAMLFPAFVLCAAAVCQQPSRQPALGSRGVPVLHVDGLAFKDLNRNGKLDPFEDWRKPAGVRARDLLGRMTIEEIAGLMVHGTAPTSADGVGTGQVYDFTKAAELIQSHHVNSFITRLTPPPFAFAEQNNHLQQLAEGSRLAIPLTISTDPRSHFLYTLGASVEGGYFAKWPETTGLAAIGDADLVRTFADDVRQEYRAVGIREALSPQADLATDPRWARLNGTFGENAEIARELVNAYVDGMQHGQEGLNSGSVSTVVKHWVGYGAQAGGLDSHNSYGQKAVFSSDDLSYHLLPFTGAFAAHVAAVMPTYSILEGVTIHGKPLEQVGAGFNKQLLTDLLRNAYKFEGVILSDWAITNDCTGPCVTGLAAGDKPTFSGVGMPWGVAALSRERRFAKAVDAGVDQIGGTEDSHYLIDAVRDGLLTKERLEQSGYRILRQKFQMGLFEDPYVNPAAAAAIIGNPAFVSSGRLAQQHALVLLQNKGYLLPLSADTKKVYLFGIDANVAAAHGFIVVAKPEDADLAIIRAEAPFETLHPGYTFGSRQHEGRLDFRPGDPAFEALLQASAHVPTIFSVYLDRPAILSNVTGKATVVLGNFGISDDALFGALMGKAVPTGHLPFELPSSMQAVESQREDIPHDSEHPLFPYHFGLMNFGAGPLGQAAR